MSSILQSHWGGGSWGSRLLFILGVIVLGILSQRILGENYISGLLALAFLIGLARINREPLWQAEWPVRITVFILAGALLLLSTILKHAFSMAVLNFILLWLMGVVLWARAEVSHSKAKKLN